MNLSHIRILVGKEITSFLRDRNILIYSIVLPIFLYPLTFWVMNQIMLLQRGSADKAIPLILVQHAELAPEFVSLLETWETLQIHRDDTTSLSDADAQVLINREVNDGGPPCINITILFDQTKDFAVTAKDRLLEACDEYRQMVVSFELSRRKGEATMFRLPVVETLNIDSGKKMGALIIGMLMPMMIVIMAAMGTLYPAIDLTVGELERKTIETTMLLPVPRMEIIVGRFIAVVASGFVAVMLNIASLGLTAKHTLFLMEDSGSVVFNIPLEAYPLICITALIISAGFGATSMLIASFAGNFREAQSYVTPFFIVSFQPAIIATFPGITLTWTLAVIPIANAAIMFRDAINGVYDWPKIAVVLATLTLFSTVMLIIAAKRLGSEQTFFLRKPESEPKISQRKTLFSWRRS